MKLTIRAQGYVKIISVKAGTLLSDALRQAGIHPSMPCGGRRTCGKCRVVAAGAFSPPDAEELRFLSTQGERLACFARIVGDGEVTLEGNFNETRVLTCGALPTVKYDAFPEGSLGFAVDIGTTTVVTYLYSLANRQLLSTRGEMNRQVAFGADVIARIDYANRHTLKEPHEIIVEQLTRMFEESLTETGASPGRVQHLVITGNTTMLHFLTGKDPRGIAEAPFEAQSYFGFEIAASRLFPMFGTTTALYLPACVRSYVGADITCAMASTGLHRQERALLLDIGTNGEMALSAGGKLLCCATAAGPAFEGAQIRMGMTAAPGAVKKVRLAGGAVSLETVGDAPAIGLCGTGMVSAVCAMLQAGVLDETGAVQETGHAFGRYVTEVEGQAAFRLGESSVFITQQDIRSIQLAKSAIAAGLSTLLREAELSETDISTIYLCGGFGNCIDREEAAAIGLIPSALVKHAVMAGNAAGTGAAAMLLSSALRRELEETARRAQELSLSESAYFMEQYLEQMLFPGTS